MRKFTESAQSQSAPHRQTTTPATRAQPPPSSGSAGPSHRGDLSSAWTADQSGRSVGGTEAPLPSAALSEGWGGGPEPAAEEDAPAAEEQTPGSTDEEADMKTFLTIEIKNGSSSSGGAPQRSTPRANMGITASNALGQRTELTLGLRATPFKISSSTFNSAPSIKMETPPSVQVACPAPDLPNGSSTQPKPEERPEKLTPEQLAAIEDEELLDKMLDESTDFEERRLIRAAMRDLRKRKRDQREKERESRLQELRQQRDAQKPSSRAGAGGGPPGRSQGARGAGGEVVIRKLEKSADGTRSAKSPRRTDSHSPVYTLSTFINCHWNLNLLQQRLVCPADDRSRSSRSTVVETSYVQKTDRGTMESKSYSFSSSTSSISSNTTKKVGSVFDRTDDSSSRGGALATVERRQAERKKELMRAQTMPKTSSMQARKAMIEKLDKDNSGGSGGPAVMKINRVQRSTSFGVPNANSIKQMLLDWCRAKTRSYEHVDIQNFSSSWSNGMAFCALVHHFFPEAFDYSSLSPSERRHNFDLAFTTAETMVDCPQLLDVDDMVKMREPDWKCVYTYLQEFYRAW
uniref:Calponin-homology (CH) domain-containing protein n=1 Tax=Neogobius melanostomus TaxID=47308 RepID=A0A8C6S7N5_9GOBI